MALEGASCDLIEENKKIYIYIRIKPSHVLLRLFFSFFFFFFVFFFLFFLFSSIKSQEAPSRAIAR